MHDRPLQLAVVMNLRGGALNPFMAAGRACGSALATSPLTTNVATATVLSVLADGIAQKISAGDDAPATWDIARSRWQVLWGALVSGIAMSQWFAFLGSLFPDARTSLVELGKKLFVNQVWCPNATAPTRLPTAVTRFALPQLPSLAHARALNL